MTLTFDTHLNKLFDVIEMPIYNSLINKNLTSNFEIINCIDLNVANSNKYFPIISSILKNNDYYNNDLSHDFLDVRLMSTHIFDNLEELVNKYFIEINPFLDRIYEYLLFVDQLLDEFHQILNIKNECIKRTITKEEYTKAYQQYKLKLDQKTKIFYDKYYENNNLEKNKKVVKQIMARSFKKQ